MTQTTETGEFVADWQRFRKEWNAELRRPYGLLAPIGLHWLTDRPEPIGTVPGTWSAAAGGITVRTERADGIRLDDTALDGETTLDVATGDRPLLRHGDIRIDLLYVPAWGSEPAKSAVRPLDPHSAALQAFTTNGIPSYAPDPAWAVPAEYVPYDEPRVDIRGSVVDHLTKQLVVTGKVVFSLGGANHELEVYGGKPDQIHISFRDATSGVTTYGGARVVMVDVPDRPANRAFSFTIDFNRATNPPCALTAHATCALPPPGNVLPVAVTAGEQLPPWRDDLRPMP